MLSRKEFLAVVLPPLSEGEHYCSWGNKYVSSRPKPLVRQSFSTSIDELNALSNALEADGFNSFFGLAKFGPSDNGRFADNAVSLKSFFIDLDCGARQTLLDYRRWPSCFKEVLQRYEAF
jgi:hypothetical protein